ncbi:MAG: Npt1/Npt2 family nucleotide transporter [bacterium]
MTPTAQGDRKSRVEKLLSVFTEVQAGEGGRVLLLALNIFLIFTAYYIIKPVREALILSGGGAELKSYASAGQAVLLLLVFVPLYGRLASRVSRRRLINSVNIFFISNLLLFYVLAQLELNLGLAFFLWVGIFNLMVPALFWSFANDVYTVAQGKRLFVLVAFGASLGAIAGSWVTGRLIEPFGVYQLLLVSSGLLGVALLLTNSVERNSVAVDGSEATDVAGLDDVSTAEPDTQGMGDENAFRLVIKHRYLLLIALLVLFLNWVNTTGEYILGRTVAEFASTEAARAAGDVGFDRDAFMTGYIGKFYADFFTGVNILGVLVQLFLVSRILKYLGVRVAMLILPFIAVGGYLLLIFFPILTVVRWAKTAENATDYSLQNTVRHALFLPTNREQKYKAKQAIDTFFQRAGDVFSALLVYVGVHHLQLGIKGFAVANLVLVAVWIALALAIGKEYVRRTGEQRG